VIYDNKFRVATKGSRKVENERI